jgi:hypothetical protein
MGFEADDKVVIDPDILPLPNNAPARENPVIFRRPFRSLIFFAGWQTGEVIPSFNGRC